MRDLGEQNLTLLEQAKKGAAKAALEQVEQGGKEMSVEATTDGTVEASINAPVKGGFTVSAFVKSSVKKIKDAAAGFKVSKKFVLACLLVIPSPVYAQVQDYQVSVYQPSASAPMTTLDVAAVAITCNLAPSPTQPINPLALEWTDPANTGRVCRWTDHTTGPLVGAPVGAYEVTLRYRNTAGLGPESNRASFSRLAPPTTAPAGLRPARPGS